MAKGDAKKEISSVMDAALRKAEWESKETGVASLIAIHLKKSLSSCHFKLLTYWRGRFISKCKRFSAVNRLGGKRIWHTIY